MERTRAASVVARPEQCPPLHSATLADCYCRSVDLVRPRVCQTFGPYVWLSERERERDRREPPTAQGICLRWITASAYAAGGLKLWHLRRGPAGREDRGTQAAIFSGGCVPNIDTASLCVSEVETTQAVQTEASVFQIKHSASTC